MKVACIIPVYLTSDILLDFTKQTIESIKSTDNEIGIYVIINHTLPEFYPSEDKFKLDPSIKSFKILDNSKGNEVPVSWNFGIKTALADGYDYVVVMNNDLVLHYKCIDNIVKFADMHPEFSLWTASEWIDVRTLNGIKEANIEWSFDEHPHFSLFMVNQKTVDNVGWFDENLKMAYFEDALYHYQMLRLGFKAGKTAAAKFYHYGSRSIKVDDALYDKNKRTYEDNRSYVYRKCGVDFHSKVFDPPEKILEAGFKYPFNDPTKSWRI